MKKHTLAALAILAIPGCADQLMSDNRLQGAVGSALNDPNVTISGRHFDGATNTYVVAKTNHGTYSCTVNGGGALALGIINPPVCTPMGTATMSVDNPDRSTSAPYRAVSQARRDAARSHARAVQNNSVTESLQRQQVAVQASEATR